MLEPHAPHKPVHTVREFLVHMAAIALGLLLALGLEQSVVAVHHAGQRRAFDAAVTKTLQRDLDKDADYKVWLRDYRNHLAALRTAIVARLAGDKAAAAPSTDRQTAVLKGLASSASYEPAVADGTGSILTPDQVRKFTSIKVNLFYLERHRDRWADALGDLEAFQERFVDSTGNLFTGPPRQGPTLASLSTVDLNEYLARLSTLIQRTDFFLARIEIFDTMARHFLRGEPAVDAARDFQPVH